MPDNSPSFVQCFSPAWQRAHLFPLWAPWIAHFLNNTMLNLVQIQGSSGELQPAVAMSVVVVIALAFLALAVGPLLKRLKLPHLRPWNA